MLQVNQRADVTPRGGGTGITDSSRPLVLCQVSRTTNQNTNNGVKTQISFTTELLDTDNMWAITDPTKIFIPSDGTYETIVVAQWAQNNNGKREVQCYFNGAESGPGQGGDSNNVTSTAWPSKKIFFDMAAGNYFSLAAWQLSGGVLAVQQAMITVRKLYEVTGATWMNARRDCGGGGSDRFQGMKLSYTGPLAVPRNTHVKISWDSTIYNQGQDLFTWSSSVNPTRITIQAAGWYRVFANSLWENVVAIDVSGRGTTIKVNDVFQQGYILEDVVWSSPAAQQAYNLYHLNVGDYVEVTAWQITGAAGTYNLTSSFICIWPVSLD